jgi:hypothetical protein
MTFDHDIENEDGEVIATVFVEALFSPHVPAALSGRPEDCYPEEGGEIEELTVFLDGHDVTEQLDKIFTPDTRKSIEDAAYAQYNPRKERSFDHD